MILKKKTGKGTRIWSYENVYAYDVVQIDVYIKKLLNASVYYKKMIEYYHSNVYKLPELWTVINFFECLVSLLIGNRIINFILKSS